ncbi:hypothetical protein DAPPUDRAFT_224340 [Daphnia pulex]|uniref:Uncharacterized protein n=1 Tax=Daphnia pulex TaxID=6669 RepID=E9GH16_DAPPU|nr:hypothetical protein DAPPUDRAFT_224340 [Daphnia pulex]|eukprot:EFX81124.1 hypothetical protein DAPPUDRAFT_224340 [Daphnia pulex]
MAISSTQMISFVVQLTKNESTISSPKNFVVDDRRLFICPRHSKLQKLVNSFNIDNVNAQPPNPSGSQKPGDSNGNDLQDASVPLDENNQNKLIVTSGQEKVDSAEGRKITNSYLERNEAILELDERRLLVRICVSHMFMLTGKEDLYPSAALKEELAKAIVEAFPCLAIPVDSFN